MDISRRTDILMETTARLDLVTKPACLALS